MFLLFSTLANFEKNKAIGCKTLQGGLFENKVKEKHKLWVTYSNKMNIAHLTLHSPGLVSNLLIKIA